MGNDTDSYKYRKLWLGVGATVLTLLVLQVSGSADVLGGLGKVFNMAVDKVPQAIDAIIKKLGG